MKKISSAAIIESAILVLAGIGLVIFLAVNNQRATFFSEESSSSSSPAQATAAKERPIGYGTDAFPPEPTGSESPWQLKEPSIRVLSPASGETLEVGKTFTIRWDTTGITERNISLYLYKYNGWTENYKSPATVIADSVSFKSGSYHWTIPEVYGYPKYSIFISDKGGYMTACYSGEGVPKDCILSWNFGTSDFFHVVEKQ